MFRLSLLFFIFLVTGAEARVFKMGNEEFSSYFLVTYGPSLVKDSAFLNESSATAYDKSSTVNTSGEFGFTYAVGAIGWRIGFEMIKPTVLADVSATNAGGTTLYQLKSESSVYAPKLGLELYLWRRETKRIFIFGYSGTASLALKNDYTSVTIAPSATHSAEMKGAANLAGGGIGYEGLMFDTTTFIFELGYRTLTFPSMTYTKAVTTFSGAKVIGDPVLDTLGAARSMSYTGYYGTIGFRFWLL